LLKKIELPWLAPVADAWLGAATRGRPAHAVLLSGVRGVGKRAAAEWMARQRLGIAPSTALPEFRNEVTGAADEASLDALHPDLRWVRPLEDKQTIHIDQIRELVGELSLTSYEGGAKVAVIEPANAMTGSAANSLLKTLEEPPGDALLLLVADRMGTLPATILSRCQRLTIATPPESVSLAWLNRLQPAANWPSALRMAGHAPLAAIEARERLDVTDAMARDFAQVAERRLSPIDVAARWSKYEPYFVLGWIGRQVQRSIYRSISGSLGGSIRGASGSAGDSFEGDLAESVLNRVDRRNLFCYLDVINRVRSQAPGSFNVALTLESLLIDWAQGLQHSGDRFIRGGLLPIPDGKVNA
jgi:DNA polymerase-3 subunit delta'